MATEELIAKEAETSVAKCDHKNMDIKSVTSNIIDNKQNINLTSHIVTAKDK